MGRRIILNKRPRKILCRQTSVVRRFQPIVSYRRRKHWANLNNGMRLKKSLPRLPLLQNQPSRWPVRLRQVFHHRLSSCWARLRGPETAAVVGKMLTQRVMVVRRWSGLSKLTLTKKDSNSCRMSRNLADCLEQGCLIISNANEPMSHRLFRTRITWEFSARLSKLKCSLLRRRNFSS